MSAFIANRLMGLALQLEQPDLAVDLFETVFGFPALDSTATASALQLFRADSEEKNAAESWRNIALTAPTGSDDDLGSDPLPSVSVFWSLFLFADSKAATRTKLRANNFVCTTAAKAYGRLMRVDAALALLPWLEEQVGEAADVYFMRFGKHMNVYYSALSVSACLVRCCTCVRRPSECARRRVSSGRPFPPGTCPTRWPRPTASCLCTPSSTSEFLRWHFQPQIYLYYTDQS